MELHDKEVQQLILFKSKLYEILMLENEHTTIIPKLLDLIKNEFTLKAVTIYLFDEWEEQFVPASSTLDLHKNEPRRTKISKEEIHILEFHTPNENNQVLVPMKNQENIIGFLLLDLQENQTTSKKLITTINEECTKVIDRSQKYTKFLNEELRYEKLFGLTAKFHSSMDIDEVLGEVILTLQKVYPSFKYYLLLSHDNVENENLPIKDLQYNNYDNSPAIQAYVTGDIQKEDIVVDQKSILYAPLKGKQGVYGVLEVIASGNIKFPNQEINFIELLANTAGSALENAQLYQQSKRLVADLQLINDTTHKLNSNLRLNDTISFMSGQISRYLLGDEVGFVFIKKDNQIEVLDGSTVYFSSDDSLQIIEYVRSRLIQERDTLFIGDFDYGSDNDADQESSVFRSIMAVPMVQSGVVIGFAIVLHRNPYFFSFETFKLFQSLIHHSTLAFSNSTLREELENLVITDHLTKLYSRNFLDDQIHLSMERDGFGTFLLIDIDNFKAINDTFGHQIGDSVIVQVANVLEANIRDNDIGARWGGEELAVYLPGVDLEIGIVIANRLVKKVQDNTTPQVTISCGVAHWSAEHKDSVQQLFHRADQALYIAKDTGKNKVVVQDLLIQ
ncbi:sensor domain-containing diguanylate cyclase [Litchfieldia salsa]|uniref:Diguanylate cyclase (GGDEF) domain-containing protein n=1 Tax=Litchfieldia salsa TaxID=930152 RepID=A0A1H0P5J5_9BACI|nr:sensor domain-containing diguanylate cyclase [Litchfieldia salsa]SDP00231.1 diguanylate cyclase (GGDEF) domain-containing protein [Litchfieldia salsa]